MDNKYAIETYSYQGMGMAAALPGHIHIECLFILPTYSKANRSNL